MRITGNDKFLIDGTTSQVSNIPSRISFYTAGNSQHTPSERLRITSDGKVGIGDFSQSNPAFYSSICPWY